MADLFPLLLFSISTTLTPGPNNFMLLNSGLHFGIKRSLPHYLGICLGFQMMVLLVALGLGKVFTLYAWINQVLKIMGVIYMLYLAWQILNIRVNCQEKSNIKKPFSFSQAIMFQWVNPKAWLMAISAISIFSISVNYLVNAFAISTMFLLICLPCLGIWLIFGVILQNALKEDKHHRWFNISMAICLVASVIMMILE